MVIRAGEQHCISKRRAVDDLLGPFVVPGKFHTNGQIGATIEQQPSHRQSRVIKLSDRMEDWCLPTDSRFIDRGTSIYIRSAIE